MERMLNYGTGSIWSVSHGEGMPVIMINGGAGCDDYLEEVSAMMEHRCQVVRFEARGCGRSSWDGCYDFDTMVEDIDFVRDQWGFERVALVGHSFGPDIGLAYTIAHPDRVLGLIGIAGGRVVDDRQWHDAYDRGRVDPGEKYPKEFISDLPVNKVASVTYKAYIKRPGLLANVAKVTCPVSYIMAGKDIRPSWPARQLAALLPKGTFVEIAGAEHCIWLTHPEELKQELHAALNRIET